MKKRLKISPARFIKEEAGQALILMLIFLIMGSLTLVPTLAYMRTALKTSTNYEHKTNAYYAADAGIEDAVWQIKYDGLQALFGSPSFNYDFNTVAEYLLDEPVNDLITNVTIQSVWIPSNVSPPDDPYTAMEILESNKLMVSGTAGPDPEDPTYYVMVYFYPYEEEGDDLMIKSVGVWLPTGFSYIPDSSNLESFGGTHDKFVESVTPHAGGQAIVWDFYDWDSSSVSDNFTYFPNVEIGVSENTTITFEYTPDVEGTQPNCISWITTSGVVEDILDVTWDIDTRIYKITSTAGDTLVEAYASRCELRDMNDAMAGDYKAVGNSLLIDYNHDVYQIREKALAESSATVSNIPQDGEVIAAYLYWSGWYNSIPRVNLVTDSCINFGAWTKSGTDWLVSSGTFKGHHVSGAPDADRYLSMNTIRDISSYKSGTIAVSWQQKESSSNNNLIPADALKFRFSGDGGSTWSEYYTAFSDDIGTSWQNCIESVPDAYMTHNFKMQFYFTGFGDTGDDFYIDNFAIVNLQPDTSVVFKINGDQVYLNGDGLPLQGSGQVTAADWTVLENQEGQHSYACKRDVTRLLKEFSDEGDKDQPTGNALYTVGGVNATPGEPGTYHWAYAGWSLIIIYFSPEMAGHHLYLYDEFAWAKENQNLDFDGDGEPGGSISGFLVPEQIEGETEAARLTCFVAEGDSWTYWGTSTRGDQLKFNGTALSDGIDIGDVWNSESIGMSEDGMDIDTFSVTWASELLLAGDTSAHIDLPTLTDNWNLIYMILSVRSMTTIGSTTHYMISGN